MAALSGDGAISLRVLAVINEERNAHGLRYHDYARYRKHCSNKIHRLRQTLKLSHGKEKSFKKPAPVAQEKLKDGHLLLDLMETERAWAYAQELVLQHTKDKARTTRQLAMSKFRRAIESSDRLRERMDAFYAEGKATAVSRAEAVAYRLILQGRFLSVKSLFDTAILQLSVCHAILAKLVASASSSRDQALYSVFIDEISPEIRFAAHTLGRSKAYDIEGIVAELAPKNGTSVAEDYDALLGALQSSGAGSSREDLEPLIWDGEPVPLRSPELVDVFLKVQHAVKVLEGEGKKRKPASTATSAETSRGKIASFDAVLSSLSDAESLAKKLSESQQPGSASSLGPGARDAHFIHSFTSYKLLAYRIQRDLLLAEALLQPTTPAKGTAAKEEAIDIRVYPAVIKTLDSVLQSLEQLRALSITDETPDVANALELRTSFTKARRCRYLSLAHASVKNYASAIALNSSATIYLREASTLGSASSPEEVYFFQPDPTQDQAVLALEEALDSDAQRLKKEWFAYNGGAVNPQARQKKPLFFDVALNYIESPLDRIQARAGIAPTIATAPIPEKPKRGRVEEEVEKEVPPAPTASSGGITGFLGSWWGRRTLLIKLVSTAQTGYFYTKTKRRMGPTLSLMKYDPIAGRHVLFKERKLK